MPTPIDSANFYQEAVQELPKSPDDIKLEHLLAHEQAFVESIQTLALHNGMVNNDESITSPTNITRPFVVDHREGKEVRSIFPPGVYQLILRLGDDLIEVAKNFQIADTTRRQIAAQMAESNDSGKSDLVEIYHQLFKDILKELFLKDNRYEFLFALSLFASGDSGYSLMLSGINSAQKRDLGNPSIRSLAGGFVKSFKIPEEEGITYCPFTGIVSLLMNHALIHIKNNHSQGIVMTDVRTNPRLDDHNVLGD